MRISDWSSDVCSSDLSLRTRFSNLANILEDRSRNEEVLVLDRPVLTCADWQRLKAYFGDAVAELEDRKSVVEGKSVSVRVDLGGRRIIKKQHDHRTLEYRHR